VLNQVYKIPANFFETNLNITKSFYAQFFQLFFFLQISPPDPLYAFFPIRATYPSHLILFYLKDHVFVCGVQYRT